MRSYERNSKSNVLPLPVIDVGVMKKNIINLVAKIQRCEDEPKLSRTRGTKKRRRPRVD